MTTVFNFTISSEGFFPNFKVDIDSLKKEIMDSDITVALKSVSVLNGNCVVEFKTDISTEESDALLDVVQAHLGDPSPPPSRVEVVGEDGTHLISSKYKSLNVTPLIRGGNKTQIISQNFCDKHTWYSTSTRRTNQSLIDSGDGYVFNLSIGKIGVDVTHGRVTHERRIRDTYKPIVKVNNIVKTEVDPHSNVGDYVIDYSTMSVAFRQIQSGNTVIMDFSEVNDSRWYLKPLPGKRLRIVSAELQFSTDAVMDDTFIFQPRGDVAKFTALAPYCSENGGPFPPGTMLPLGEPTCYQTVFDLISEANLSYPKVPALQHNPPSWRDTTSEVLIFSWDYGEQAAIDISDGVGLDPNDIEICLEHDTEMTGSYAVVTFYCVSEDI